MPVPYFHVVFTLPEELNGIAFQNQSIVYNILLKTSADTIKELSLNPKYLGAQGGHISILHTWGQNLTLHPHVHLIVPGGGLSATGQWRNSRKKFFIPVKVIAKKFRGKFLYHLKQAKLAFQGQIEFLNDSHEWQQLLNTLYEKNWYVYCKRPFKSTYSVLAYLGRYTHRIAISNHRLVSLHNGEVSFKWRDYRDEGRQKVMTLSVIEFMRRFLLHVLPAGFTKIRHYGFLSCASKKVKLALIKRLIGAPSTATPSKLSAIELMKKLTGRDITLCPSCGVGHFHFATGTSPPSA